MKLLKKLFSLMLCLTIAVSAFAVGTPNEARADVASGVVYGDVTGDLQVKMDDVVLIQKHIAQLEKFTATQVKLADVNVDNEVTMADVVMIQSYIAGLLLSFDADKLVQDYISRIEWISELVYALELKFSEMDIENKDINFKDVTDPVEIEDLKYAVAAGIVSQDSRLFYPDEPAKREFVAVTLVNALGFYGDYPLDCSDASEIEEKNAVALALKTNYLALKDGKFFPETNITENEMKGIIYKIDLLELSTKISDQYSEIIDYKENVMLASRGAEYEVDNNNTFRIASLLLGDVGVGDVYVLPANEQYPTGLPCKITNITHDGVFAICEYETPKLGEIYDKINSQGIAQADIENIEVADEDTITVEAKNTAQSNGPHAPRQYEFDDSDSYKLFDTLSLSLKDHEIKKGVKVSASIDIKKPTVSYAIDADISLDEVDIRNFYIDLKKDLVFDCTLKADANALTGAESSVQLAKVPFALGTTGLFVDMTIYLKITASGSISISYTLGDVCGIQIKDNVPRFINDVSKSECDVSASITMAVGAEVKLALTAFELIDLLKISIGAGFKLEMSNYQNHGATLCNDACTWLYSDIGVSSSLLSSDWANLNLKWSIFSKSNSPLRWDIHFENGIAVGECTYTEEEANDFEYDVVNNQAVIWDCPDADSTTVVIPPEIDGNKVVGISEGAFLGMDNIEKIEMPTSVISIGDRAFYGCTGLTSITVTEGVKSIGEGAFEGCKNLDKVFLADTITSIGEDAFKDCSPTIVLYGVENGYAHKYAIRNTIAFVSLR